MSSGSYSEIIQISMQECVRAVTHALEFTALAPGEKTVMIRFDKRQDPEKALDFVVVAMASKRPNANPLSGGR